MTVEFKVTVQDTPGTLARLGRILGEARVNVEAIQGTSREGKGFIQFVPNDEDKAALTLDAAAIAYSKREVLVVRVLDEPGVLGDVALVMSKAALTSTRSTSQRGGTSFSGSTTWRGRSKSPPAWRSWPSSSRGLRVSEHVSRRRP
jgi:ACT domain